MYNPQLDTFLCVVECGSFNKAAEKLYITPPAVIKQINLLEENLDLQKNHPQIHITDFDFYNMAVFNRCENSNDILIAVENWKDVHPLLKIRPVDWGYAIPFGLLHSPTPSLKVQRFLMAVAKAFRPENGRG